MHNTAVIAPSTTGYSVYAKLVMVSCIWGGTFVAGRYIAADIAPLLSACLRFVLASATLMAVLAMRRQLVIGLTARQLFTVVALGFFGIFAYNIFFFYGLQHINASRASLIVALNPALIAPRYSRLNSWSCRISPIAARLISPCSSAAQHSIRVPAITE